MSDDSDKSGRSVLVRNMSASYAGHLIFVIFGFLMPRIIDESLGQVALGVWDFSWSLVSYLGLSMLGIGSSVNRYVARYLAKDDFVALNSTISSVIAIQLAVALVVIAISLVLCVFVPVWFSSKLGDYAETTRFVIIFLGGALAMQMAFDANRGIITGCHRWDYYNFLNSGGYFVTASLMICVLFLGGGLADIAAVYFTATVVTELVRWRLAHFVLPDLKLSYRLVNMGDMKKVARFGLKSALMPMANIATAQTINVFIVASLGPAALAILARPLALMRQISTLSDKYSNILTPIFGSLQGSGNDGEIKKTALSSSYFGWLIAIPPLMFLMMMGDLVVELWMGPGYADWQITSVLAAGFMLKVAQGPLLRILVGLNLHGAVAKAGSFFVLLTLGLGLLAMRHIGWSVQNAAMFVAIALGLVPGLVTSVYGVRYLNIGVVEYWNKVLRKNVLLMLLLAAALYACRWIAVDRPVVAILSGLFVTTLIVAMLNRAYVMELFRRFRSRRVTS